MLKIVEDALEAEVSDALGRGYYERGGQPGRGYRSGAHLTRLKTAEGVVEYAAPQVADRIEPFLSRIREQRGQLTQALEELAVEMYAWASRARRCCAPRASAPTGQEVLLHLAPGTKEDTESCLAFFQDLKRRGLPDALVAATMALPADSRRRIVFPALAPAALSGAPEPEPAEQGA